MEHDANKLEEENKLLRRALKADDLEIEMTVLKKAHEELKDEFKKAQKVFSDELDHVRIEKQGFASKIFCLETRNQEMETLLTDKENEMKKLKEELDEKTAKLEKATSVIKNKFGLAFYYWKEKKDLELKLKNLKEVAELEAREKHLEQYTQSDCVSSTPESRDLGSRV
ncbi:unnamed protein product [Orchesella dallaii]|uniref:Uncharacterized protein n=1 Tax=Orchesella dallaii TaxID=48710 RepID=A0ABP1RXT9_9HEXA